MTVLLYGQHPRSEELVKTSRSFDRGKATAEELHFLQKKDRLDLLSLQSGLPFRNSGLIHWDDLVRPLHDLIIDSTVGSLTRFFETNMFWRLIILNKTFRLDEAAIDKWISHYYLPNPDGGNVFTLPFLFLLRDFTRGIKLEDLSKLLCAIAIRLDKYPKSILVFSEPNLGWRNITEDEKKKGYQLIQEIKKSCRIPVAISQSFFSVDEELDYLFSLPVDGIGIDFYHNTVNRTLPSFPREKILLAGIIHTDSTLPEGRQHLEAFFSQTNPFVSRDRVYITPSGPPELLPREVMDLKVKTMREGWT